MQNIVVSKIDSDVADAFDARFVLPFLVGEINAIPAL